MADIRIIEPAEYNLKLAEALKQSGDFPKPTWIDLVKTGAHKQRPVIDEDFWYRRAASILRQAYTRGVIGVGRLRTRYGGRKDMGMQPPRFIKAGGKIIRLILQQAETAGLLEKTKGKRAGRQLTANGRQFMEAIK
ncbi:40S ribosomal protein S19 [Candidatus Pacearchaeota archaeon]|nr:40S ribosomal protein S19 [Candidatus Pacearchaeota archaeon]